MMQNTQKKAAGKKNNVLLIIAALVVVGAAAATTLLNKQKAQVPGDSKPSATASTLDDQGNLVISVADVSDTAKFYSFEEDGTTMEVIAVKASDGSIRTAFNTCQVCFSSGKGYYKQDGNALVCQNCGNRFSMDDVEVTRGGCNPIPITEDFKTQTDSQITISKDLFVQAKEIFENWKA